MNDPFALCADDYAISEGVSRAMLRLADAGRLTAISAMATMPGWKGQAADLRTRRGRVAAGLHFDLTLRPFEGRLPAPPLPRLIRDALARRLDVAALRAEFERQLASFEDALGFAPDHVDGHHHVHALPGIRDVVLTALAARYGGRPASARPLLRNPGEGLTRIARRPDALGKALVVAGLAAGFGAAARRAGFAANHGFSGFSRFSAREGDYAPEFAASLRALGPRPLVMCHPGFPDPALRALERVADARQREFDFLMSEADLPHRILRVARDADALVMAFAAWTV